MGFRGRRGRGQIVWSGVGAAALLVGSLGAGALLAGTAGAATTSTALTNVTATATTTSYTVSFTVNEALGTPALLAISVPGTQFPTTGQPFSVTCTACAGAPAPAASVWGVGATPAQTGSSSIVLNLFASGATASPPYSGTFAAGSRLTVVLPVTPPSNAGSYPITVATEVSPGVIAESALAIITGPGVGVPPPVTQLVTVTSVTPNSAGYPHATWVTKIANLGQDTTVQQLSLYVPGTTFPTTSSNYSIATCTEYPAGTTHTPTVVAGCTHVAVAVDTTHSSGLPGTAVVLTTTVTATLTTTVLSSFVLTVTGVTNPAGSAGATSASMTAAKSAPTSADVAGRGTSDAVTFVASPSVGLSSTNHPKFPTSAIVGTTADFGLNIANASDYTWPSKKASVAFTLSGIPSLSPADIGLQCSYEGTAPAGSTATTVFTVTASGSTLVSNSVVVPLTAGTTLQLDCALAFSGTAPTGKLTVAATLSDTTGSSPFVLSSASSTLTVLPVPITGYTLDASDGGIFTYGTAQFYGSTGGKPLNQPIVGMAMTPTGKGYWEVASDGGIFAFGNAQFYGSMGGKALNKPIVGMATTPNGEGYWLVASDGGIFTFGDASFYGSAGSLTLQALVVGMAATPNGTGYWLVASDGGIFTYGTAAFYGSTGSLKLKAPVVGMASTATGNGYWEVAADGGVFTFGDATFEGSAGALTLNKPVVGMLATADGQGYWLTAADGGIFTYGDATFEGSAGALTLNKPVVGIS